MNLKQQIINEKIENTGQQLKCQKDIAFLRFAHSLFTDKSIHEFNNNDLVDGAQEKQIDTITIEQDDDKATIYILQVKNTTGFSSNTVIKMRNGLEWVFNKSRADINKLSNTKFKDKILEYRSLQSSIGPSNLEIKVAFITNGLTRELSDEFKQEQKTVMDTYNNGTFAKFDLAVWGAEELVYEINRIERTNRKTNANITIKYDANNPSLIKYHTSILKGMICTVAAKEIARIVNDDRDDSIFDSNIRRFLGSRGAVNSDIKKTCTDPTISNQFWFLNNGITIVCDRFDAVTDPDSPLVKIENMQIVNGCQTAKTLAFAANENALLDDTQVLLRIYETTNLNIVDKIVLTTNNQNKITSRDLHANDPEQRDMEDGFKKYGYYYERKLRQYDNSKSIDANKIIPNEIVAQSYLALVLRMPADASRRKYKVWGELYDKIFNGKHGIEPYILSTLIHKQVSIILSDPIYSENSDDLKRKICNNASFHIARIVAFLFRNNDQWFDIKNTIIKDLRKCIEMLENNPNVLKPHVDNSINIILDVIGKETKYSNDIINALKLASLNEDIEKHLYSA